MTATLADADWTVQEDQEPDRTIHANVASDAELTASKGASDLRCTTCGVALTYSGRGRKPSKCPEHRVSRSGSSKPTRSSGSVDLSAIQAGLDTMFTGVAMAVGMFEPTDGAIIAQGGPQLSSALVKVAENDPRVRKALERLMTGSAWGQVIAAAGAIVVPILAHHGVMPNIGGVRK